VALGAGIAIATSEFVNFDQAIVNSSAKFKDLAQAADGGKAGMKALREAARQTGKDTQFSAVEAAKGLEFLAMAGFDSQQAIASLPKVVDLATASNTDLATASDIASDTLGAFGLMTTDTAKLTENLTRVNDVFAKTVTSSNTTLEQMFEAVKAGGPVFKSSGFQIEDFSALLATLADSGVKGEAAGTALRNVILRLAGPTPKAARLIKKLGVEIKDSSGNFRDINEIMNDFNVATKDMGKVQKAATLDVIFGKRAIVSTNIIMDKGINKLNKFRESLENAGGSSAEMAAKMRKGLLNRLKILQSSLIEVGLKFLDVFSKQGSGALDAITKAVQKFDPTPVAEGLKDVGSAIFTVFKVLKFLSPVLLPIVSAFVAYKIALGAATAAQLLFNIVMTANPVGIVIVAIGALIGLILLLAKNWDAVSAAILKATDFVVDGFMFLWEWFNRLLDNRFFRTFAIIFMPFLAIPALIIRNWEPIRKFFEDTMIFITVVWSRLKPFFDALVGFIIAKWDENKSWIIPFLKLPFLIITHWSKIEPFFENLGLFMKDMFDDIIKVAERLGDIAEDVIGDIVGGFAKLPQLGIDLLSGETEFDDDDLEDDEEIANGFGGGLPKNLLSPESAIQRSIEEKKSLSELIVTDTTGGKVVPKGKLGPGITLRQSGVGVGG
jgi:TP901 family phage tail tape measure protein